MLVGVHPPDLRGEGRMRLGASAASRQRSGDDEARRRGRGDQGGDVEPEGDRDREICGGSRDREHLYAADVLHQGEVMAGDQQASNPKARTPRPWLRLKPSGANGVQHGQSQVPAAGSISGIVRQLDRGGSAGAPAVGRKPCGSSRSRGRWASVWAGSTGTSRTGSRCSMRCCTEWERAGVDEVFDVVEVDGGDPRSRLRRLFVLTMSSGGKLLLQVEWRSAVGPDATKRSPTIAEGRQQADELHALPVWSHLRRRR
jgi:hypothetical protein